MPTVLRTRQGWAVRIYPNDHRPPHVHVVSREAEARFELLADESGDAFGVRLIDNHGFSLAQINGIGQELTRAVSRLWSKWQEIHG